MVKKYWLISSFDLQEAESFINAKAKEGWDLKQFTVVPGSESEPNTEYVALMEIEFISEEETQDMIKSNSGASK